MIDTYIAPNLVFCSDPGLVPYTTYYQYGSWPAGGCSSQEKCWSVFQFTDSNPNVKIDLVYSPQTAPNPREHIFDSGATIWYACEPSSDPVYVTTQLGYFSVDLAFYTASDTASTVTNSSLVPTSVSSSGSAPSSTASRNSTSTGAEGHRNHTIGPIVGGVIGGVVALCIAAVIVIVVVRRSRVKAHEVQPATVNYEDAASLPEFKPELEANPQNRNTSFRNSTHAELVGSGIVYEAPGN
jgi:hypothetical protein